jgi:hypothetical protein
MMKKLTWQSAERMRIAISQNRKVGVCGRPPYLENEELELVKEELLLQTKMGNYLKLSDIGLIVFFNYFYLFF